MTIEEKVKEILSPLLNLSEDYAVEFGDTCVMCGFPLSKKNREKMILEATKAILALIKPMSREKLILIIQESELATGVGPFEKWKAGIKQLADAILAKWGKE